MSGDEIILFSRDHNIGYSTTNSLSVRACELLNWRICFFIQALGGPIFAMSYNYTAVCNNTSSICFLLKSHQTMQVICEWRN